MFLTLALLSSSPHIHSALGIERHQGPKALLRLQVPDDSRCYNSLSLIPSLPNWPMSLHWQAASMPLVTRDPWGSSPSPPWSEYTQSPASALGPREGLTPVAPVLPFLILDIQSRGKIPAGRTQTPGGLQSQSQASLLGHQCPLLGTFLQPLGSTWVHGQGLQHAVTQTSF